MSLGTREFEGINPHWNPKAEAFFFWRLVQMKKATAHTVQQDLLMTEQSLQRLIRQYPQEKGTLKDIYEQRLETWKEFCYLLKHPQAVGKFKRAASIYAGGKAS